MKYPIEVKIKVVSEYENGKNGYKKLANKYHLTRDTVRSWVLANKVRSITKSKIREESKSIEYYKMEAEFWKNYAKKLEEKLKALCPEEYSNDNLENQEESKAENQEENKDKPAE